MGSRSSDEPPKLRSGVDLTRADLTFEEGLVASRIDGTLNLEALAVAVAMPIHVVAGILARLREKDILAGNQPSSDPYAGRIFPLPLMQAEADLTEEERKRIIFTVEQLEVWNHYEVPGVRRRDDAHAVKRAYQQKVLEWHPDRWRRPRLGPFQKMITQVFERVKKAYETLADESARVAYDAEHAAFYVDEQDMAEMLAQQRRRERDELRARERLERRKRRNPVRKRLERAREQYRQALAHREAGEVIPALRAAQMALTWDPKNEDYAALEASLAEQAGEQRIAPLMKTGSHLEKMTRWAEAIECFERAVRFAPDHGPARLRLAYNLLQGGRDAHEARQHAQKAVDLLSDEPEAHYVLGLCYERADMHKAAVRAYGQAVDLKPNYADAKKRLNRLRWGWGF